MDGPETTPPRARALEGWIRTLRGDALLQPLLVVIVGHIVAFLVPLCLLAARDHNPFAALALSILLVASGAALYEDWRRIRRPGPIGGILLIIWTLAAVASVVASRFLLC